MQVWNKKVYRETEDANLSLIINNMDFVIHEHRYIEFVEQGVSYHTNTLRDNANVLYYIEEGSGWIESGDERIPIEAGNIYLHPCVKDKEYRSVFLAGTKKIYIYFYFDLFGCNDVFSQIRGFRCIKDENNIILRMKEIVLSGSVSGQLLLPGLIVESLFPVFKELEGYLMERLMIGKRYHFLFEYINKNLSHNLTLDMVSKDTGVSISTLTHSIPQKLGFTIKQYIQKKILKEICLELLYTDIRIKDIADKYGFASEVYFSEWFFKLYNIRPRDYRNIFVSRKIEDYCIYISKP